MLKVSTSEASFILDGIKQNIRSDGRGRTDFRKLVVETGVLTQSNGSARVTSATAKSESLTGGGQTDVLASSKAQIISPTSPESDVGVIELNVACSPAVCAKFEGRFASELNTELSLLMTRLVADSCHKLLESLCIVQGSHVWQLNIDVRVFDSGGNLADAIAVATFAALRDTVLPKLQVTKSDDSVVIEVDQDPAVGTTLDLSSFPLVVTVNKVEKFLLLDATLEEECIPNDTVATLHVAVDAEGNVGGVQKYGSGVSVHEMQAMIDLARNVAIKGLFTRLTQMLDTEQQKKDQDTSSAATIGYLDD